MIIILSIIFIIIDQLSKIIIVNNLTNNKSIEVIKSFFYLTYTNNKGAAFSILTGRRILLILVALIVIGVLIYYVRKNKIEGKVNKIALSLVIGGSIGNLIDRILRGAVVDFIDVKIFGYNFPIFNLADTFIVIGVFLLIIEMFRKEHKNDN
ncbi:MAG: signal peptidase II [Bacilli bacterium]